MDVETMANRAGKDRLAAVVDPNGRDVLAFAGEMRNLSRTAALVDSIVDMHESGKWRTYETALGSQRWLECEFDYFLIACEATYDEISRVLAWNREGKGLVSAMESNDSSKRRTIEDAAAGWRSPTGETLVDRAARQGWTNSRGQMRPAPVPARARSRLRHGVSMDEYARQRRAKRISSERRRELDKTASQLASELNEVELRYVRDSLAAELAAVKGRSSGTTPLDEESRGGVAPAHGDVA
jgi:hypothetical protein